MDRKGTSHGTGHMDMETPMSITCREREKEKLCFMHVVYYQHFDGLNYSIQEDLIIKHTLLLGLQLYKIILSHPKDTIYLLFSSY